MYQSQRSSLSFNESVEFNKSTSELQLQDILSKKASMSADDDDKEEEDPILIIQNKFDE
jgi:hypothetical protein